MNNTTSKALMLLSAIVLGASLYMMRDGASAPVLPAQTQAQQTEVVLVNETDWVIDHLYLCPAGTGNWGSDYLGVSSLKQGDKLTIRLTNCDAVDVKVVDEQGRDCVVRAAQLCSPSGTWTLQAQAVAGCGH